ncbi:IS3 family transposase [Peribacillus simplex]|uniref:IS3 family transposase n=1 Tax=Peribacillus simplex TaxID=1478 RepID=UPI0037C75C75
MDKFPLLVNLRSNQTNSSYRKFVWHVKVQMLFLQDFESMDHFEKELDDYIHFYSHERMKEILKDLSPIENRSQVLEAA